MTGDYIEYIVASPESLPRLLNSSHELFILFDEDSFNSRCELTVSPYAGPALPALDDGALGWIIRERDGGATIRAFK
jgi:hypothetical protein